MDVLAIAAAGLKAQQQRVNASANNIANATTTGAVPSDTGAGAASTVYRPLSVNLTAQTINGEPGGVRADVIENKNGYSLVYDPNNQNANAEGYIAAPNVDFVQETVSIMESRQVFKANTAVIRAEKEMQDSLMDILA